MKSYEFRKHWAQGARYALMVLLLFPMVTCSDSDDDGVVSIQSDTGILEVSVITTGEEQDEDGYSVVLKQGTSRPVEPNGLVTFRDVPSGTYWVKLEGLKVTCDQPLEQPEILVVIKKGETKAITFEVQCTEKPIIYSYTTGVYRMNLIGTGQAQLSEGTGAVWSKDGMKIAFWSPEDGVYEDGVYTMNDDGTALMNVLVGGTGVAWSPDGNHLVSVLDNQLVTLNADGSGVTVITELEGVLTDPEWGTDSRILFAYKPTGGDGGIFAVNADGSGLERLTTGDDGYPAWSHDGTRIAFSRTEEAVSSIYILDMNTGSLQLRTKEGNSEIAPRWSPDDTQLLFISRYIAICGGWYPDTECELMQITIGTLNGDESDRIGYPSYVSLTADWRPSR